MTCRHDHRLPYALVKPEVDDRISKAIGHWQASRHHELPEKELADTILQSSFKVQLAASACEHRI